MFLELINEQTGEIRYPVDVHGENADYSIPATWGGGTINGRTYKRVVQVDPVAFNATTHAREEGVPVLIDGVWTQTWNVIPLADDVAALKINNERFELYDKIKAERDRRTMNGGFSVILDGVTKWFHSDTFSRTQQIGLMMMGQAVPTGLQWKTMDGSFVVMTPTLASQIFQAAAASDMQRFAYAEALQSQVKSALVPSSIDIYAGWPPSFRE